MINSTSATLPATMTSAHRTARSMVLSLLSVIRHGSLTLIERYGEETVHRFGDEQGLHASIEVKQPDFYHRVLRGGSIGAGEAYMDNVWDSPDLTAVMQLMAQNLRMIDKLESKASALFAFADKLNHWLRRNSSGRAKKNIEAHYDIGNALYQLFLDENMLYSSALYLTESDSLQQAQINKMDRLCRQLQLSPQDHVLEIGTGWGAMAIYMAQQYGCRVTTTTISEQQYAYAKQKIEALGLQDRITLLKQDYRNLGGQFDKLVSIEMVEAVGKQYLSTYIRTCNTLLKPGGLMALQAITITDQRYEAYSKRVDFIQKYIFPGGFLPSVTALTQACTRHSDLVAIDLKDIGIDYARTLQAWQQNFVAALPEVSALGYNERFIRMWRFYLSYCEGGFLAQTISTVHLTLRKQA